MMDLRLGEWLGLPAGHADLAAFRWTLMLLAVTWAALSLRSRPPVVLLAGMVYTTAAVGFWSLALARPYGLLIDPDTTRWAAQVSVTAGTGHPAEGFLSGEPAVATLWSHLAALGVPAEIVLLLPSLLPVVILPAVAIAIWSLWNDRERVLLGCCLWLAFSTGELDAHRGVGFVSSAWGHPEAVLTFLPLVAAVLAAGRILSGSRLGLPVCAALVGLWGLHPGATPPMPLPNSLLLLALDQGPWLVLALVGARRGLDAATAASVGVGGLLVVACGLPLGVDPWRAQATYRLGLILAATGPLQHLATRVGEALIKYRPLRHFVAERVGIAALLLLFVPGSFLTRWDPARLDPTARASLEPLSTNLKAAMERIREETAASGVFLASPEYAPHVAVLAGRRVLLAPTLVASPADLERRRRAEREALSGADPGSLGQRYGLRYVLITPGDFRQYGIEDPADLTDRASLRLLFTARGGFRVYEIAARADPPTE
ncbi:MAG: hypothetical protein ABI672_08020 [Vicinamibacteria bacterium]